MCESMEKTRTSERSDDRLSVRGGVRLCSFVRVCSHVMDPVKLLNTNDLD